MSPKPEPPLYTATHQAPIALALAALRGPQAGTVYPLIMGPLLVGRDVQARQPVALGLFAAPSDADPIHPLLVGRASEVMPGTYSRPLPVRTLLEVLRPRTAHGPAKLWAVAESVRWRIAWPLTVIPDAQALLPLL